MADDREREHQFDYSALSSKVISGERTRTREPTGEAESLKGRILPSAMGDKAIHSKPDVPRREQVEVVEKTKVTGFVRPKGLLYYPKLRETRELYETLLTMCQPLLGDQPDDIIKGAVDEVLAILKAEGVQETAKRQEMEAILGPLPAEDFAKYYSLSKQLVDYQVRAETVQSEAPADVQIPVVFETETKVQDLQDAIESEAELELPEQMELADTETAQPRAASESVDLDPTDIDGFWLWRQLEKATGSLDSANALEPEVLAALNSPDRVCESALVQLLGFDRLPLIRLLQANKFAIASCTRLGRVKTEEERNTLKAELASDPRGQALLESLNLAGKPVKKQKLMQPSDRVSQADVQSTSRNLIDLTQLEFSYSQRVIAQQEKVILPPGSKETSHKGFEELFIPAPPPQNHIQKLRKISELPEWVRPAFPKLRELNAIQSHVFEAAFERSENLLICAPTGAGKTNIALLTILSEVSKHFRSNSTIDLSSFKVIYVAPMKALVSEVCGNLRNRLAPFDIEVRELTGDSHLTKQQIKSTQVIVTTPEKWDIVTRKSGDRTFTEFVKLLIIDEIHLLHDLRGPVLEALVARVVRGLDSRSEEVRLVGLSATLPNYEDVGAFLRVKPSGLFFFDKTFRPVPLDQRFIGITEKKAVKRMLLLNEICYEQVLAHAGKNQVLVFVHSRRETVKTAKALKDTAVAKQEQQRFLHEESKSKELLTKLADTAITADLRELLPMGFAVHHAGLPVEDRRLVEELFAGKHVQVLVSTATLAWGVNLPAHTVIIKGTQVYSPEKGAWVELSPQDMLQMLGRAGRIDYDDKGEGVVITSHSQLRYYLSLLNQQLPIESQFISQLADHLNAEVSLGNVATLRDGMNWLAYSYLYIRMKRAPALYGISESVIETDPTLVQMRTDLIHSAATLLDRAGLIRYTQATGVLAPTSLGKVAASYYLKPASISIYNEHLKSFMGPIDLLRLFGLSLEFKYLPVREEERQEVARLMERVPYPVKGAMDEPTSKMNVLLQAYISRLKLEGFTLMSDMVYISQSAGRIMKALFEICLRRGWAQLTNVTLNFCKMIEHRMWSVMNPLRQFQQLPDDVLLKLEKKEGLDWERFFEMTEQQFSELLKGPKYAAKVHALVHSFPRLQVSAYVLPLTRACLKIELAIVKDFTWDVRLHNQSLVFWIFVEDVDGELLLHSEQFVLKRKYCDQEHFAVFTVPYFEQQSPNYFVRIVSEKWMRAETVIPISFKHLILPQKNQKPSELAFETLVPVSALRWPEVEKTYDFPQFNKIQSNVFSSVYESPNSVFVGAPAGSGRSTIAELAIFRHLAQDSGKILYLVGVSAQLKYRTRKINERLANIDLRATMLSGELASDLEGIAKSKIIVATAEQWDHISRRWRQRKAVHDISLVIVDDVHLIGEPGGTLETVISRVRFISAQLECRIRLVALSASVSNAWDLAEWMGISHQHCYSFAPEVAPVPLTLTFHGFDQNHRASRLIAMSRPLYQAIASLAGSAPVIVFVPDRKTARLTALDLLAYSAGDEAQKQFLRCEEDALPQVANKVLKHTIAAGVGFVYEGMAATDCEAVIDAFDSGKLQILVVTIAMCWSITSRAKLVLMVDTLKYEGREKHYTDYTIPETLHALGRAGRQNIDQSCDFVMLCHTPKKEFYKKFLKEPIPIESHLDHYLRDHFNAEIVSKTVSTKQDAVDWITWTFLYRRLVQNPNYYNLQGVSGSHINAFLSEIVETTIADLSKAGFVEEGEDLTPENLGTIAAFYYVKCATLETFSNSLIASVRIRGLFEVLSAASEFDSIAVRHGDDKVLRDIAQHLPEPVEREFYNDPHTKTLVLLLAHCARMPLPGDLAFDQKQVLEKVSKLIHSMVDVLSSNGWLKPALLAMTLSQITVQAMTERDSPLKQLPHFSTELVEACSDAEVNDLVDLMNMEDEQRRALLRMSEQEIMDVARVCNGYPSLALRFRAPETVNKDDQVKVQVALEREGDPAPVYSPYFPTAKDEGWWAAVGDPTSNRLFAIKKFAIGATASLILSFPAPEPGDYELTMYVMSDCYMGVDQGERFHLTVIE